ncbi:helix-turn-helix domain-containing protein [Conexibacter sp. CPCC 206217]|uniref:helix-turn-helix domain-containing protein n=1 Tax=Conexibacter sp. CPCC 206217 TaxID=3064574 RepID=UPI00271A07E0|nr:helix-turn-helix domain-containing protein [Conexibacter sp. CPCC 206217]MDO8210220.1 helix-turn-helix domain-containing protein [Conexibacter sp. CPCC 206217]
MQKAGVRAEAQDGTSGDDAVAIFQDVLESVLDDRPLGETLDLIARRVSELGAFDFCAIVLPEGDGRKVRIGGSYNFPPRYAERASHVFDAAIQEINTSPTARALAERRSILIADTESDPSYTDWRALAAEFGFRSILSVPLITHGSAVGVLNGYSNRPVPLEAIRLDSIETLAGHASLAVQLTMLVESRQETIDELQRANDQLEAHRAMLERAHQIHLRLTGAVLEGAGFQSVAQTLANVVGRPVLITDADGRIVSRSETPPELAAEQLLPDRMDDLDAAAQRTRALAGAEAGGELGMQPDPTSADAIVAAIRIASDTLGYVVVPAADAASRALDVRAVEHAATVLALHIVKTRAERATEERLRSDFLADLLSGRDPEERAVERARHYGMVLDQPHRVVTIAVEEAEAGAAAAKSHRSQLLRLVADSLHKRLPAALVGQVSGFVSAAVPLAALDPRSVDALRAAVDDVGAAVRRYAPTVTLTSGIGGEAAQPAAFVTSFTQAQQCLALLRRLGRGGDTISIDELGILGLFVEHGRPEQLVGIAHAVLGPVLASDARSNGALLATLRAYLDRSCDVRATAAALFVHPNTVKYRIRRIEELCDLSLARPQDLLELTIATLSLRLVEPQD